MESVKAFFLQNQATLTLLMSSGIGYTLLRSYKQLLKYRNEQVAKVQRPKRLVLVTGCDSGLGLSMALWAGEMGYNVIAGCLSEQSAGAIYLRERFLSPDLRDSTRLAANKNNNSNPDGSSKLRIVQLDVTDELSIENFRIQCEQFIQEHDTKLWAVISNAAVLVCGEFFWQTKTQRRMQFEVNFWGTANLAHELQPLLFEHQSRLIIISSDCSKTPFPGLASYGGSKAALEAWARSLRLEVGKYGVSVTSYQPGSFPQNSQIFARNKINMEQMELSMTEVDKEFYSDYFKQWKEIKSQFVDGLQAIGPLEDKRLKSDFQFMLEGDIRHVSVLMYDKWYQKIISGVELFFPRWMSDKMLCALMDNGAKWTMNKSYRALIRNIPK